MIIQISSKLFTLVLVVGDDNASQKLEKQMGADQKGPPEKQPQLPVGSSEALKPTVIGFVKNE